MPPVDLRHWLPSLALGIWLGLVAVWPAMVIRVKYAHVLLQPALVLSLLVLTVIQSREGGWGKSAGRTLWIYLVLNVSAWLPFLHTTTFPIDYPYPRAYELYLFAYEAAIAALVGFQAALNVFGRSWSWWVADGWSRLLVVAPVLLVARGFQVGHWVTPLMGVAFGVTLAAFRSRGGAFKLSSVRLWRLVPLGVFLFGAVLVFASGLRIYEQIGPRFPAASDDGLAYFQMAVAMAREPGLFFTPRLGDENFFSGYYPVMALWFMGVGPHIPSWLLWHGLAGGMLAFVTYRIGEFLMSPGWGLIASALIVADRVTLHLLATMNMETFFLPALYLAILLWMRAGEEPRSRLAANSLVAGLVLGLATIFRPTAALLPLAWAAMLFLERGRHPTGLLARQTGWMLTGFGMALIPLLLRHRVAWGYWTLSGVKGFLSSRQNYALEINGQHLVDIGLGAWLRLVAADPGVIWRKVVPGWWEQGLRLWTHPGFGQMDLVQGLNHVGPYQAALTGVMVASVLVGAGLAVRRRTQLDLAILPLPVYFTGLVLGFYILNSRYRAPFIPALYLLSCIGFSLATTVKQPLSQGLRPTK